MCRPVALPTVKKIDNHINPTTLGSIPYLSLEHGDDIIELYMANVGSAKVQGSKLKWIQTPHDEWIQVLSALSVPDLIADSFLEGGLHDRGEGLGRDRPRLPVASPVHLRRRQVRAAGGQEVHQLRTEHGNIQVCVLGKGLLSSDLRLSVVS